MKKWIVSLLVFLSVLTITAIIGFYTAIFLIGPHSDILPTYLFIPVGIIIILLVFSVPVFIGNKTYERIKKSEDKSN
jgi:hypothetical protein